MLFHPANLIYWVLLGIGVTFFLLIIISGGGDEGGEIDGDVDINLDSNGFNLDADVDADIDAEAEFDSGDNGFSPWRFLGWFGLGKAPLMILLGIDFSAWGMTGWILNTILGSLTGKIPEGFLGLGGVVFIVSLITGLFVGKLLSNPLGKIFSSFSEDVSSERLIGCVGTVTTKTIPYLTEGKIGQADVYDLAGNLVTISVCLPHWANVIPHNGQAILIIERQEHSYIGIMKDSSDEDKWFSRSTLPD